MKRFSLALSSSVFKLGLRDVHLFCYSYRNVMAYSDGCNVSVKCTLCVYRYRILLLIYVNLKFDSNPTTSLGE